MQNKQLNAGIFFIALLVVANSTATLQHSIENLTLSVKDLRNQMAAMTTSVQGWEQYLLRQSQQQLSQQLQPNQQPSFSFPQQQPPSQPPTQQQPFPNPQNFRQPQANVTAQPSNQTAAVSVQNSPIPIVILHGSSFLLKSAIWYLNSTDHYYHIGGIFINKIPGAASVNIGFGVYAKGTSTELARGHGRFWFYPQDGVPANVPFRYDMNIGLNSTDIPRFKTMDAELG